MKKERKGRQLAFALGLLVLVSACLPGFARAEATEEAEKIQLEIYVYDLSAGCEGLGVPCRPEVLVNSTDQYYRHLLQDLGVIDEVRLRVHNLRFADQKDAVIEMDPEAEDYFDKPYPLIFLNGSFERNMEKSLESFTRGLRCALPEDQLDAYDAALAALIEERQNYPREDRMIYVTRENCPYCEKIKDKLEPFRDERFEVYDLADEDNIALYRRYLSLYGYGEGEAQPSTLVPAIFVNDVYLRGSGRVTDYLAELNPEESYQTFQLPDEGADASNP